ncbi:hypothetical protein JCM3774_001949 [Rhodotorula dairenensis]
MATKRCRPRASDERSPSPTLPLHLYTSLPTFASSSSAGRGPSTSTSTRGLPRAIEAREATVLDPREHRTGTGTDTYDGRTHTWSGLVQLHHRGAAADLVLDTTAEQREVITDRYDILHLLPSVPSLPPTAAAPTPDPYPACTCSGAGFEDLPSDHEELFFLNSTEDRNDVARRKKRRRLEFEREARVRERIHQDGDDDLDEDGARGGRDRDGEQPPAEVRELMSRLHATLSRSGNPSLLELRILTHHGSDPRFASFLKRDGTWRAWWEDLRAGRRTTEKGRPSTAGLGLEGEGKEEKGRPDSSEEGANVTGLGGLAAYGSDSDAASSSDHDRHDDDDDDGSRNGVSGLVADTDSETAATHGKSPSAEQASTGTGFRSVSLLSNTPLGGGDVIPGRGPEGGDILATTSVLKSNDDDDDDGERRKKKEVRAAKAREWARKRREARETQGPAVTPLTSADGSV